MTEKLKSTPAEFVKLFENAKTLSLKRGDIVYRVGDQPENIYFLESGLIGLALWGESGKDHLVRFFKAGQVFGHRSLFEKMPYHATATVIESSVIQVLSKSELREKMRGNCELAEKFLENLARELRESESKQLTLNEKEAPARIAEAVVYLKELHPNYSWTRQEIADFCGTTTPTVIRNLAHFVEEGLIEQNGREIVILDREGLLSQG